MEQREVRSRRRRKAAVARRSGGFGVPGRGGAGRRGGWRVAKGKVGPDSGGLGER